MRQPKAFLRFAAAAALLGLTACATTTDYTLAPVAQSEQTLRYRQCTPSIRSDKPSSTVSVSPAEASIDTHVAFFVAVTHNGQEPANMGVENVAVATAAGASVRTYTFAELKEAEEAAAAATALVYALAGISQASAASEPDTTTITYGDGRRTVIKSRSPVGESLARSASLDQAAERISDRDAEAEAQIAELRDNILQTTTLDPGDTMAGRIEAQKPEFVEGAENTLVVTVSFAGDDHQFRFQMQPKP